MFTLSSSPFVQYSDLSFALFELSQLNLTEAESDELWNVVMLPKETTDWLRRMADAGHTIVLF
jgi:hypothetical protein